MRSIFTIALCLVFCMSWSQSPNFVFILADDMGWNGTSVQISPTESGSKSDFYETPNLEILASQGMTFSRGYAPAAKCSPTRCAILTGESPARNSFTETGNQIASGEILIEAQNNTSIPSNDVTLAEWLKTTGLNYRTAHYGKWHLGNGGPSDHGFDFGDGETANNEGNNGDGSSIQEDPKKIFEITERGIDFMRDAKDAGEPFYLQLSHFAVHGTIQTTQESFDYYDAKPPGAVHDGVVYGGMTQDLDESIGIVMDSLETWGIDGDTYIIFLSDNGAGAGSSSEPLRGQKAYIYEGGIRVPFIVKGPNIPANTYESAPVNGYDLFPTIAEWTGSNSALPTTLDGESLVPLLTQSNSFNRPEALYFHIPHYSGQDKRPRSAAVQDNYKLIVEYETGEFFLYDLDADIDESVDISASNPTLVEEMKLKLRNHLKSVSANMPTLDHSYVNGDDDGDVDDDGLEDEWEFRELLTHTQGPNDDPDNDGLDNLTEMNLGTDPLSDDNNPVIGDGGFENGWDIWIDGGSDCRRNINDATYANSGSYCIRLRDDDPLSSFMTTEVLDLTPYDEISVDFSYITWSFESGDEFLFEISTDGGSTYTLIEDWAFQTDFENDERHNPTLIIPGPFTTDCTLRFRCNANRNNDHVFIDDVYITGVLSLNNQPPVNKIVVSKEPEYDNIVEQNFENTLSDLRLFPNPTSGNLNVQFSLKEASEIQMIVSDISGQILRNRIWEADSGRQKITEQAGDLPQGYYFLQLITPNGKLSEKFVVIQ